MPHDAFSYEFDEAAATLTVRGEIDDRSLHAIKAAIETYRYGPSLRVDLTAVTFLPSSALSILAVAQRDAINRGDTLVLVAAAGTIARRVLQIGVIPHEVA